jgi:hypothetical protein
MRKYRGCALAGFLARSVETAAKARQMVNDF